MSTSTSVISAHHGILTVCASHFNFSKAVEVVLLVVVQHFFKADTCTFNILVSRLYISTITILQKILTWQTHSHSGRFALHSQDGDWLYDRITVKCAFLTGRTATTSNHHMERLHFRNYLRFTWARNIHVPILSPELWLTGRADGLTTCWTCADKRPFCHGSWRSSRRPGTTHHQQHPAEKRDCTQSGLCLIKRILCGLTKRSWAPMSPDSYLRV